MTELETNEETTRTEVATYLREFAAQLDPSVAAPGSDHFRETEDRDQRVTFLVGSDSATVDPPSTVDFSVEVDSDSSLIHSGTEHEVSLELAWQEESTDDGSQESLEIK
jgi:hypothetical protein